jgi:hypothetical protein
VSLDHRYHFNLDDPVAVPVGVDKAHVIQGELVAIPQEDSKLFDVFRDDGAGNPAGERLVELGWPSLREFLDKPNPRSS